MEPILATVLPIVNGLDAIGRSHLGTAYNCGCGSSAAPYNELSGNWGSPQGLRGGSALDPWNLTWVMPA